jgi:hypothetical protein
MHAFHKVLLPAAPASPDLAQQEDMTQLLLLSRLSLNEMQRWVQYKTKAEVVNLMQHAVADGAKII